MPEPTKNYSIYDVIALNNIDDEDFTFEYDRSSGNLPHTIPTGQIKRFPRFLAEHAMKHLIDKILTKKKILINNANARSEIASQIIIDEEVFQAKSDKTQAERQQEDIDKMNRPSDLEAILEKTRKNKPKEEVTPKTEPVPEPEETFQGLEKKNVAGPELDLTESKVEKTVEKTEEVKAMPTRNEVYQYAEKQGMVIDDKSKDKFDKMKVTDLLKELGDPREALA